MKTIDKHLKNIKSIQDELNTQWQQGLNNIVALHENCGGKIDDSGNFILNREQAISYFANEKHLINYCSIDPISDEKLNSLKQDKR